MCINISDAWPPPQRVWIYKTSQRPGTSTKMSWFCTHLYQMSAPPHLRLPSAACIRCTMHLVNYHSLPTTVRRISKHSSSERNIRQRDRRRQPQKRQTLTHNADRGRLTMMDGLRTELPFPEHMCERRSPGSLTASMSNQLCFHCHPRCRSHCRLCWRLCYRRHCHCRCLLRRPCCHFLR